MSEPSYAAHYRGLALAAVVRVLPVAPVMFLSERYADELRRLTPVTQGQCADVVSD